jgi:hypothetical protein
MSTITLTLQTTPDQFTRADTFVIDPNTREVLGDAQGRPAMYDPKSLLGFQDSPDVQRVMIFADELWVANPQMAVGKYPVFTGSTSTGSGIFFIALAVESVTVEEA